jgi:hypothetical protein
MVFEGTLDEFIREFSAKPIGQHHLYDVSTGYQPAFEQNILSAPDVTKIIARGFSRTSPMHRRCCRAVGVIQKSVPSWLSDVAFRASTHTAGF